MNLMSWKVGPGSHTCNPCPIQEPWHFRVQAVFPDTEIWRWTRPYKVLGTLFPNFSVDKDRGRASQTSRPPDPTVIHSFIQSYVHSFIL